MILLLISHFTLSINGFIPNNLYEQIRQFFI
jgi:hypothetical protein